ncbi:MAG TPA: aminopeptidase [Candidatus Paceibacterota bacterium]|nr:aminopeptidase [Candidatus Paceibacterota bacterium]
MKAYTPSQAVLTRYADVLVNFALGHGKGIKSGDVVYLNGSESAKPLFMAVRNKILEVGGHAILNYQPEGDDRYNFSVDFFERAKDHQLDFFPHHYFRGLVDQVDHVLFILGDNNPHALKGIDPKKIMRRGKAMKQYMDWRRQKEHQGKLSWTIALYGTPAMAREAGLSIEAYWKEIIQACFLDEKDPIKKWNKVYEEIHSYKKKLNALSPKIDKLHIEGEDADLWITLGKKRKWLSGRGANIPSFEIFTSPDWRGTNGWIRFNQPLYRYGNKVTGIELVFKDGKVIKNKAKTGEKLLKEMIATPGANRLGEFSMTDRRHSRITKFMAETLFDENMGGPQGNTHVALGASYEDTYAGDVSRLTKKQSMALGFNDSSVHTDVITTTKRRVTAYFYDRKTKVIYDNGQFVL